MENCVDIEKVFENRKSVSAEVQLYNFNVLYKLLRRLKVKENILKGNEEIHYICSHPNLLSQLIHILRDTEDVQICIYATNVLYYLLILSSDDEKQVIMKTLNTSEHLNLLTECTYNIHSKFCEIKEYNESFLNIQNKLLHIISTIYQVKKCRKLTMNVSENTIRFLGCLVSSHHTNKELMLFLLPVLKIVCLQKKNSEILSSQEFFDCLYFSCKLTQKLSSAAFILKLMSRSVISLQCIANNQNIVNLVVNLINYTGKRVLNKRYLMTVLYRITSISNGLKLFLEADGFDVLFNFFMKSDSNRLAAIKAYTILYRTLATINLPSNYPNTVFQKSEDGDESSSEESDLETDVSEDENQDDGVEKASERLHNYSKTNQYFYSKYNIDEMAIYFAEVNNCQSNITKLDILEDSLKSFTATSLPVQETIAARIFNSKYSNRQAYPDMLMLDAQNEDHYLNTSTNDFSVDYLGYKLMCAKNISQHKYKSKIVYNVDNGIASNIPNNCTNLSKDEVNNSLQFESRFECGNLLSAKQTDNFEYELMLNSDTNSCNGHQWFYFQISNMIAGVVYVFNIVNFMKINSQYNYGMQPILFSVKDYTSNSIGWRRCGQKIIYHGNNYADTTRTKQFRTLSFFITFQHDNDSVYIAYHYPYTYTRLMTFLSPLIYYNNSNGIYARIDKLCSTTSGKNEVPLLTITATSNADQPNRISLNKRPLIFITSRVHPGETNSSWIMEGIIKYLLDIHNEQAIKVREHFIFKIIPMLNPEGVIYGNTRNGLNGIDLNRCWLKPNQNKCPEIYYTKKLLEYAKNVLQQPISLYIDIHGHSRKKFFFLYGCNPTMSWNKSDATYGDCEDILKIFPQMIQHFNPHIRLNYCKYKIQKAKESTGRVVVWRELGISQSYTLECSYCSGAAQQTMNTKILSDIGGSIIAALGIIIDDAVVSTKFLSTLGIDNFHLHKCIDRKSTKEDNFNL